MVAIVLAVTRLFTGAALALVLLGGAWLYLDSARASDDAARPKTLRPLPAGSDARNLVLGSKDSTQPQNMNQFLTAVTKDVDSYWTNVFQESGLPEPRVSYMWIPAGQTAASACGDENGTLGDSAAAYCGRRHDLHLAGVRDRHLQRSARPGPARQLPGLWADDR